MSDRATRECSTSPTIGYVEAFESPERLAHGEEVEERLCRMLVLAVSGVDDVGVRRSRDEIRSADVRVADHDHVRVVLGERQGRVLERLALVDRRAGRPERHRVGGEPLRGEVEAGEGAGRGLVEEVDDQSPAQCGELLHFAVERPRNGRCGAE